jgi:hypothetical protein
MLALLFGLIITASLATSALIHFEVLAASPLVLTVVGGIHFVFGAFFLKGYLDYRALHRLVGQGRGELFSYVITALIRRARAPGFADHYRVRHVQGAALAGLPDRALEAAEAFRAEVPSPGHAAALDVMAAEVAANAEMGRPWWAEQRLATARSRAGRKRHCGLEAAAARLAWVRGDAARAVDELVRLPVERRFPFGRVVDARRQLWLADALRDIGNHEDASIAYSRAIEHAPKSHWGEQARHGRARLSLGARGVGEGFFHAAVEGTAPPL